MSAHLERGLADLCQRVVEHTAHDPHQPVFVPFAVSGEAAVPLSREALCQRALVLAAAFVRRGLDASRVALAVNAGPEAACLYLACQFAGIAPAMVPVPAQPHEVRDFATIVAPLVAAFEPEVVLFDGATFELLRDAGQLDVWRGAARAAAYTEGELAEARDAGDALEHPVERPLEAPQHFLFTSGTTGRSKVVRLSRAAVAFNSLYVAERWGYAAGDRLPVLGAPYHSAGLMVGLIMPIYMGACGVFMARGAGARAHEMLSVEQPAAWLRYLSESQCTHLACGDGLLRALVQPRPNPDVEDLRYPALRAIIIGGEPLARSTYELVERHFEPRASRDFCIFTAYGMTEAAGLIATSTKRRPTQLQLQISELDRGRVKLAGRLDNDIAVISCGTPSHGVTVRVVDEHGKSLPDKTLGRVEFQSDSLFDGYVTDPKDAFSRELGPVDGSSGASGAPFFPTGDIGFLKDGEIFIRGRVKEAVPIGCALVPAERIESVMRCACGPRAGEHNVATRPLEHPEPCGAQPAVELLALQELAGDGGEPASWDKVARAMAEALFGVFPLATVRVVLVASGALPRLRTSAKKVRIPAAAALERGELPALFDRVFAREATAITRQTVARSPNQVDIAWSAADLEADRRWLFELTAREHDALANCLAARSSAAELLSSIDRRIERALLETRDGVGFAVLRGFPVEASVVDLEHMLGAVGSALGRLMPQNEAGERLTHVCHRAQPGARGYLSNEALDFHSDTADMLALFCVRNARCGGETALVSSLRIFNELAASNAPDVREAMEVLRQGFVYAYPDQAGQGGQAGQTGQAGDPPFAASDALPERIPVFSDCSGRVSCRYLRAFIELAEQRFGVRLSERERRALDRFDQVAAHSDLQLRLRLEPGDILLVNNYTVLHSRTAFDDPGAESGKRLLLRLWINVPSFRPIVPALKKLSERFQKQPNQVVGGSFRVAEVNTHFR
ncbi:AMP-binding protein [Pendulispora albinea]|uniref:AMP-binding protein n=1 Tax=Pendulispora albinea TaxID=2741071 RepID=A0ABZ2M953_9BACT